MAIQVNDAVNASHSNPLIGNQKLRQLYSAMLKCRLLQERARILNAQTISNSSFCPPSRKEATAVGAAIDLLPQDAVASSKRDFVLDFIKGAPLSAIFGQLSGHGTRPDNRRLAPTKFNPSPAHAVPGAANAAHLNIRTGLALASRIGGTGKIVMAFLEQGSLSRDASIKALHFGWARKLPVVYVWRSNLRADPASSSAHARSEQLDLNPDNSGFPAIAVDGNDAVAMYRVAHEAIERARFGGGPTLIQAERYRCEAGPTKDLDSKAQEQLNDPIAAMERYLTGKGLFSNAWKQEVSAAFHKEFDLAFAMAEQTPSEPIECLNSLSLPTI